MNERPGRGPAQPEAARILVFIPMYNCAPQIPRVLAQLQNPEVARFVSGVVCVDNRSTDDTAKAAAAALEQLDLPSRTLLQNDQNYGLGGSHKVAIDFARAEGYSHLIVLHGDDQGNIADILPELAAGQHLSHDFLMGARFMPGSRLVGYSMLRTVANKLFNLLFSAVSGQRLYDLGSGLNLFRVSAFDDDFHRRFADDLTFNYYLILAVTLRKARLRFFPLTWSELDQVSNAKLWRMGWQILRLLGLRVMDARRFLTAEHRKTARANYSARALARWSGERST